MRTALRTIRCNQEGAAEHSRKNVGRCGDAWERKKFSKREKEATTVVSFLV